MTEIEAKKLIRDVPNFPKEEILFKDLTTAFKNAECLNWFANTMANKYENCGITKVLGIESRGFIIAPIVATKLNAGFVPVRKKGKLPADVIEESYSKEYGIDIIEMHNDAIDENDIVLIHDDLLATGGTIAAAVRLAKKAGAKKIYVSFLVELGDLNGRDAIDNDIDVYSIIKY